MNESVSSTGRDTVGSVKWEMDGRSDAIADLLFERHHPFVGSQLMATPLASHVCSHASFVMKELMCVSKMEGKPCESTVTYFEISGTRKAPARSPDWTH